MKQDKLPWHDSKKWKIGNWYPMQVGSMWTDSLYVFEAWDIFELDPTETNGDVLPVAHDFKFQQAVEICEAHNKESFNLV